MTSQKIVNRNISQQRLSQNWIQITQPIDANDCHRWGMVWLIFMRLNSELTSYPLAMTSCSQLWLTQLFQVRLKRCKMESCSTQKVKQTRCLSKSQLLTSYPLAAASYSQLWLTQLFQVGLKRCKKESWSTQQVQ